MTPEPEPLADTVRMTKVVVLRLVGGTLEGQWWEIEGRPLNLKGFEGGVVREIVMVPTGSVEWDGDRCAEVYVPEGKLDVWRAEHDVEER